MTPSTTMVQPSTAITGATTAIAPGFDVHKYIEVLRRRSTVGHACPDCGGPLVHGEGCVICPVCGYSNCG